MSNVYPNIKSGLSSISAWVAKCPHCGEPDGFRSFPDFMHCDAARKHQLAASIAAAKSLLECHGYTVANPGGTP